MKSEEGISRLIGADERRTDALNTSNQVQKNCLELRKAYEEGLLGNQTMPEDTHPHFASEEERLSYSTLPMGLNYQRNSHTLWEATKLAFDDSEIKCIFP